MSPIIYKIIPFKCVSCGALCFNNALCYDCERKLNRLGEFEIYPQKKWQRSFAVFKYQGPIVDLIHRFKFEKGWGLAKYFANEMVKILPEKYSCDLILPVPLHLDKLHHRGYNQSFLISKIIAKYLNVKILNNTLICSKNISLVGLNKTERYKIVKDAYFIKKTNLLFGKKVLLVDDVMTTGSTMNACVTQIKKKGAERIDVLVVAKT